MTLPGSGYGRELFSTFVPPSARARLDARARAGHALLSGALVARHAPALAGPVIEVTWAGKAALTGVLRAARHEDLVVAVGVPAFARTAGPHAPRAIMDAIMAACDAALFDRPLVVVARAIALAPGASVERLSEGLYRDLEAGFTSMGFSPSAFQGDIDELVRVTSPLVEQDLGLELELDVTSTESLVADAALVLARVDDAGLKLAAVRGAHGGDELGGALLVVDVAHAVGSLTPTSAALPMRIVIDSAMNGVARALERGDDDDRVEAAAYMATEDVVTQRLHVKGTSSRLLDALAASMR